MEKLNALNLGVSLERDEMRVIIAGGGDTIYMEAPDVQGGGTKQK